MKTNNMKVVKELPDNMTGHIIVFDDPLEVHQTKEYNEIINGTGIGGGDVKRVWFKPTGKVVDCKYMRVKGGFGAYSCCSGRMLIGEFFETIQDVLDNKSFQGGNTKCYPTGYIPELFAEHEKL